MGFILSLLAANLVFRIIVGIIGILGYVLMAIGLYDMAKRRNIGHAWFGWIPILNMYLLGELINDKIFGIPGAKWILALGPAVVGLLALFMNPDGFLFNVISILYYVFSSWAYYELYRLYRPNLALIYFISGLLITSLNGIWIFLCRKESPQLRQY